MVKSSLIVLCLLALCAGVLAQKPRKVSPSDQTFGETFGRLLQFSMFMKTVQLRGWENWFDSTRNITVFMPNNDAFNTTLQDLGYVGPHSEIELERAYSKLFSDKVINSSALLLYHVLPSMMTRDDVVSRESVLTLLRSAVKVSGEKLVDKDDINKDAVLEDFEVLTSNGNVLLVDHVLLPEEIDIDQFNLALGIAADEKSSAPDAAASTNSSSSSEANSTSNTNDSFCFPASARVSLSNGESMRMANLKAGHVVRVSEQSQYSPVFLFSHKQHLGLQTFVRIDAQTGHSISLSPGHYLYANSRLVAAAQVKVGDVVRTVDGPSKVVRVGTVRDVGLVAPHTVHTSDVVVNGIVASSYTTAVHPHLAHMLLAPVRTLVRMGVSKEPLGSLLYNGATRLASFLPSGPQLY